jgi:hypothetical protein
VTGTDITTLDVPVPRVDPCELWLHIYPELQYLISSKDSDWSEDLVNIATYWDDRAASRYPRTSVADLADFHEQYPMLVPQAFLEDMLYDLDGWQNIRKTYEVVNSTFCIRVEAGYTGANAVMAASRNRSSENHGPKMRQRRFIQPDLLGLLGQRVNDPNREIPALSTILRGIQRRKCVAACLVQADSCARRPQPTLCTMGPLSGKRTTRYQPRVSSFCL